MKHAARLFPTVLLAAASLASGCGHARLEALGVPQVEGDGSGQVARVANTLAVRASDPEAWATLAAVHLHRGDVAAARVAARRALAGDPEHVGATVIAARIEVAATRPEEALPLYARVFVIEPPLARSLAREHADAMMGAARRYADRGEADHAADTLRALATSYPVHADRLSRQRAEAWAVTAGAFVEQEVAARARDALDRARALGADAGEIAFVTAALAAIGGSSDASEELATWARRTDSGRRWMRVGDFTWGHLGAEPAEAAYLQAAAALPEDPAPLLAAARAALTAKAAARARDHWLAAARRLGPSRPDEAAALLWDGASHLSVAGHGGVAGELLTAAVKRAPDDPRGLALAASTSLVGGRAERVIALAEAWRAAHPGDEAALVEAAQVLTEAGEAAAAIALLDGHAPEVGTVDVELARVEAWVAARRAEPPLDDAAGRAMTTITALEPRVADEPAALYRLGLARLALGDRQGAQRLGRQLAVTPGGTGYELLLRGALTPALSVTSLARGLDAQLAPSAATPAFALDAARWFRLRRDSATAARWYERALDSPSAAVVEEAHDALADLYAVTKPADPGRAIEHLRAWIAATPPARRLGGLRLRAVGWATHDAPLGCQLALSDELVRRAPDDEYVAIQRFQVLSRLRRDGELRRAGEAWARTALRPSRVARRVGEELRRRGLHEDAAALLSRSAPEQVEEPALHAVMSGFFEQMGDLQRARRHAAAFIEAASGSRSIGPIKLLTFAEQLLDRDHAELAVQAARAVLAGNPDSIKATQVLGRALLRAGEREEARAVLDEYVGSNRRKVNKRLEDVARIYASEGERRLAAETLERRMVGDRTPNLAVYNELANLYRELGDVAGLERVSVEVVERSSGAALQRFYEAAVTRLTAVGALDAARRILVKGLQGRRRGRRLLAAAFLNAIQRGDRDEAVGAARSQGRAGGLADWVRVADVLTRAGMADGAVETLDDAIELHGAEPTLHMARGRARFALGDPQGAHDDFAAALTQSATVREVLTEAEPAYLRAGQVERLRDLQGRALAIGPGRSDRLVSLGASLLDAGRGDEGQQLFTRYLSTNPRGELAVARAYAAAGDGDQAIAHYGRSFEFLTSKEAEADLREAAEILAERGESDRLDGLVRLYVVANEGGATPDLTVVGQAYARVGRPEEAIAWYERADEAAPTPELAWVLGRMKDAVGDDAGAQTAFSRYVARTSASRQARRRPDRDAGAAERVVDRYLASGRPDDALAFVRQLDPGDGDAAWVGVLEARARLASGDTDDVLAGVGEPFRAWSSDPAALRGVRRLLDALVAHGRLAEARRLVQRALATGWDFALGIAEVRIDAALGRVVSAERAADALGQWHGRKARGYAGLVLAQLGFRSAARRRLLAAVEEPDVGAGPEIASELARVDPGWLASAKSSPASEGDEAADEGASAQLLSTRRDAVERGVMSARVAFQRGAYREALEALAYPLAANPRDDDTWRLALRAVAQLRDAVALDDLLERVAARHPDRVRSLSAAVEVLYHAGAFGLALHATDRLLALRRSDYREQLRGVELALALGREADAARRADALIAAVVDGPSVRADLAELYAGWLFLDEARAHLAKILGAAGGPAARRELVSARIAALTGDEEAARAACAAHLAASVAEVPARVRCAATLAEADGPWAVIAEVVSPTLLDEAPLGGLTLAAEAAWRRGDATEARALWERIRGRFPFAEDAVTVLLSAAVAAGDVERVRGLVEHALRLGALDVVEVARVASDALDAASGEATRGAVSELLIRAADAVGPGDVSVATGWQRVMSAAGDSDAGARILEDAWAREPGSAVAANNLAWALTDPGADAARALEIADQALALGASPLRVSDDWRPGVELPLPSLLDTKAWALHRLGRDAEALALVDRALRLLSTDKRAAGGELALHRAVLLEALGRHEEAALAYRDCAARGPARAWGRRCRARVLAQP